MNIYKNTAPYFDNLIVKNIASYLANLLIIWGALLIYYTQSYYVGFLRAETYTILYYIALFYTIGGGAYYYFYIFDQANSRSKKHTPSKGLLIIQAIIKIITQVIIKIISTARAGSEKSTMTQEEKTALLFGMVKFFFLPLMLNFLIVNYTILQANLHKFQNIENLLSITAFNNELFPIILTVIFTIDVAYFVFGYIFEADFLDNTVRSVEPTLLGWIVALACYPPFNGIVGFYLVWNANEYFAFESDIATFILRVFIIGFYIIYVSGSIALGTKCSNLTNRGIIDHFPYSIIRHPAYTAKNIAWWLTVLPLCLTLPFQDFIVACLAMAGWTYIYYLRAITEERHLLLDPDYQAYVKKVKWKFIPNLW